MKKEKNEALMNEQQSNEKQNKKLKMRKKLKYGSIATAVTAIVIVVVVLINILVSMLADVRLDLTSDKVYAVSEETIDYVKNLDQLIQQGGKLLFLLLIQGLHQQVCLLALVLFKAVGFLPAGRGEHQFKVTPVGDAAPLFHPARTLHLGQNLR